MWQAIEGLLIIIFVILVFGIVSLPLRHKKARATNVEAQNSSDAKVGRPAPTSDAMKLAASGTATPTYNTDQKINTAQGVGVA